MTSNPVRYDRDADSFSDATSYTERPSTTPLPKFQLFLIIFIQIAEPVTSTVIYPFINDLIRAIGITRGDEKKTGYYVGVVESIFYAAEALTVLQWGRASDSIGRRPILLGGMLGLTLSILGFGISTKYWMLILSRCAQGVFNGNIGVTKSVMAEITDETNAPLAFSFLPVAWSIGSTLGPFIGGNFASPAERWSVYFGAVQFFKDYPYFLPCFIATLIPLTAFVLSFAGLRETLPSAVERQRQREALKSMTEANEAGFLKPTTRLLSSSASCSSSQGYGATVVAAPSTTSSTPKKINCTTQQTQPPPFRALFIPRVLIPITNFAFLAFLDQSILVLLPLIYSTPLQFGGLGLSPAKIGTILGVWGVINGFVQVFFFPSVRKMLGQRTTYTSGIIGMGFCFMMFPVLSRFSVWDGGRVGPWVWFGIALQLTAYMLSYMSYACMFMYIAASAPSRSSLGTTNGLAQLTASSVRALAPSASSSLFSFSLKLLSTGSYFGGFLVYIVLGIISVAATVWSFRLPGSLGQAEEEDASENGSIN